MRPIGYACLGIIIVLILVGFITERKQLSVLGAFAFFLPSFGYFAMAMFFLTGIGILRVFWLPFWDSSIYLLKLGDVVYLPYLIIEYPFRIMGVDILDPLTILTIGIGLFIFCIGTLTWFYGKYEDKTVFDFGIYKYSRHPQYLGFLIWSYGIMILAARSPCPRGGLCVGPSFPWLISALLVICVALSEENIMRIQADEHYLIYQKTTPFMFPLPQFLLKLITAPNRLFIKKDLPRNRKEIFYTFLTYITIFIILSLPFWLKLVT